MSVCLGERGDMSTATVCSSTLQSQITGFGGGLKLQKPSLCRPSTVTITRYRRRRRSLCELHEFVSYTWVLVPNVCGADDLGPSLLVKMRS